MKLREDIVFSLESLINSIEDTIVLFDRRCVVRFVNRVNKPHHSKTYKKDHS